MFIHSEGAFPQVWMAKMPIEGEMRPPYRSGNDFYSLQGKLGQVVFGQ